MVTKKTRWLSAIAAVIMLVSMFAGIIVPAGAAAGSATLNALLKKYEALDQEHFVEVRGYTIAEMRDKIAKQIAEYEATNLEHEREIYEKIGVQLDQEFTDANLGNLVSDLIVRYSVKEYYEDVGYPTNASTYYISDADDWAAAAASGSLFSGITLLVTNDIDFKGAEVQPLTMNENPFQGVLDGQGYRFINMDINIGNTTAEKSYKYGGLVADLAGTIKNLGIDGGELTYSGQDVVTDRNEGVGSFAGHISVNGLLQNCWSTMTVTNQTFRNTFKDATTLEGNKNGVSGLIGWGEGGAIDNCFFAGIVNNDEDGHAATDLITYTANAVKVYNSIGAGTLNCDESKVSAAVGVHYSMYNDLTNFSLYNTYAVGKNAIRHRANYNPYNYETKDDDGKKIYINYVTFPDTDITFTKDIVHKFTPEATNAAYMVGSLEEAVWAVNSRFDNTHQSSDRDFIISVDANGKLYMARRTGVYRKVTLEGSFSGTYYFKEGTKVNLLSDLGMMVADSITIDKKQYLSALNGYDLTVPAEDITLTIVYSADSELAYYTTELTKRLQLYDRLDCSLFDCQQLLEDWVAATKAELAKSDKDKDLEMIKTLLELESGEEGFRSIMGLLPNVYPRTKDMEFYLDFNNSKEWAISSVEDWLELVRLSDADSFEGHTFHIRNDIDFKGQRMDPLSFDGTIADKTPFMGIIDGHGYAFKNINIRFADSGDATYVSTGNAPAGLIGTLGEGAVIRNFGVESGTIFAEKGSMQLGTFGHPQEGANVLIEKVWSGVDLSTTGSSTEVSGLVANPTKSYLVLNGGYFYGSVKGKGTAVRDTFTIAGDNTRYNAIYNTIAAPTNPEDVDASMRWTAADLKGVANNYAVGYDTVYMWDNAISGVTNDNVTAASLIEAGYKVNRNSPNLKDANGDSLKPVYFTMKDGNLAFGKEDGSDQIRKITFENKGVVISEMYAVAGTTVSLVCEKATGYDSIIKGISSTLDKEAGTLKLGNEDVTIEVVVDNTEAIEARIGELRAAMKKYEGLNLDEFANGEGIATWKTAAQKAIEEEDLLALNSAVEQEKALAEGLVLKEGFWPEFSKYETYKEFNKGNNWLIASKADWDAMDTYTKAETTPDEYFKGFTFHLKGDVSFGNVSMAPLGIESKNKKIFSGTIDGHGYGFKDVNVYYHKDSKTSKTTYYGEDMGGSIGLIAFLGDCEIRNFGIYNGIVDSKTANGKGNVSTFGCVNRGATATFTRVWSGMDLLITENGHVNALAGLRENETAAVKVNGFIFTGTMKKAKAATGDKAQRNTGYAVMGGMGAAPSDLGEFANIITSPTLKGNISASFLFAFTDASAFKSAIKNNKVKNVYGYADVANTYRVGTSGQTAGNTTVDGANYNMVAKDLSIEAAAWNINNNQDGANDPVYLTLKNGEVWYGTAENQIRRAVVMDGDKVVKTYYALPGQVITLDTITSDYILPAGSLSTLEGTKLTLGNEDVVVNILECAHTNVTNTHINGTATHTMHCNDCNKDFTIDCTLGSWTANNDLQIKDGVLTAGTHSAYCTVCGGEQTENCVGTLVPNAVDCTSVGTMTFSCCNREEAIAEGSGKEKHDYKGIWTKEGAPYGKEINPCKYCKAYESRSCGDVLVSSDNKVKPGETVDVVITLPYQLNSAKIKIAPVADSKYIITKVEGAELTMENLTQSSGIYTADLKDVQPLATITVTVEVERYTFLTNGFLDVEVTDAKNDEGDVTSAAAQAQITLDRLSGDANADGIFDVKDPLSVLQYKAGVEGVQIHTTNADMNYDGVVGMDDATLIIRAWMETI